MTSADPDSEVRSILWVARAGGALAVALGILVLTGWTLDIEPLVDILPSLPRMVPNTAIMFVCAGSAVLIETSAGDRRRRWLDLLRPALIVVVAAISTLTLAEYVSDASTGLGTALFSEEAGSNPRGMLPAPQTAASFLLLAFALATIRERRRPLLVASITAVVTALAIACAALLGYLVGVDSLYSIEGVAGVAPHTAVGLAVLCVAAFALRSQHPPGSWYACDGPGDTAVRRAMPIALLAPVAATFVADQGMDRDWWGPGFAITLMGLATLAAIQILFVQGASGVNRDAAVRRRIRSESSAHQRRFLAITDRTPLGIIETDAAGSCTFVNPRWCEIAGLTPEGARGFGWMQAVHPDDLERVWGEWRASIAVGGDFEAEFRFIHDDGGVRWTSCYSTALIREDGEVTGYLGSVLDITARREAEQAARDQTMRVVDAEERFRSAFDNAPIGLALVAPDGSWMRVNRALCDMTGYAEGELLARTFQDITHPDDLEADLALMEQTLAGEIRTYEIEKRYFHADGSTISALLSVSLVRGPDGEPHYFVSQIQDISERKRYEEELRYLSSHDALTGLANRRELGDDLRRRLAERDRYGTGFGLVLLDLDHFKYINDSLGHGVGDRVLRSAAEALQTRLRETDLVARLGGDEFACVLAGADEPTAERLAAELLATLRDLRVATGSRDLRISASAGVICTGQLEAEDEDSMLAAADLAMYEAKDAGRDRIVVFNASAGSRNRATLRLRWSHRIRSALDEERFALHYQPIVDLHDRDATMFEALLRLYDQPNGVPVLPGDFLNIADRYGLMPAIDRWVAKAVIETIASDSLPDGCTVALNVSARSLAGTELLDGVESLLERTGVDPRRIVFEVTESTAVSKLEDARRFARRIQRIGAAMALDDFGTGFGSLSHLKHIPSAYLKIDGEFIRGIGNDVQDRAVVEALVHVARKTGRRTVAEYVHDEATMEAVAELGVDMAQGFYLGRPMPLSRIATAPAFPAPQS